MTSKRGNSQFYKGGVDTVSAKSSLVWPDLCVVMSVRERKRIGRRVWFSLNKMF